MSFGGGGGFSFGTSANNQSSGFGGFGGGNNTNTNTGFGANTTSTGFGSSTATSNPFGGSTFGSNPGGFGTSAANSGSLFGNKPASNPFGSSTNTTGGLFGSPANNTTGFGTSTTGGFGSTNNAFGASNTTGSTFGGFGSANKPAFGSTTNSTPLFGQGGAGTTGSFGSPNAFGATGSGTALSNQPVPPSEGTAAVAYTPTLEKEGSGQSSNYQSINFMAPYSKYSFEELRLADYNAGRQFGNTTGQAGGFGSSTFGGFGSNTSAFGGGTANNNPFGAATTSTSFGTATTSASGFGPNSSTTGFGSGGLFGNKPAGGGLFGQQSSAAPSGGLFGTSNNTTTTNAFGGGGTGFGSGSGSGTNVFGGNASAQNKPSPFGNTTTPSFSFGQTNSANPNTGAGVFGSNNTTNANAFGNQQQSGGLFASNNNQQKSLFGNTTGGFGTSTAQSQPSGGLFGNNTASTGGGLFGGTNNNANTNAGGGLFSNNSNTTGNSLFGNNNANNAPKPGGLFGASTFGNSGANTGGGLFGNTGPNNQQQGGLFANTNNNTASGFSFGNAGNKPATNSLFGNNNANQAGGLSGQGGFGGLFGNSQNNQQGNQQQPDFKQSSLNDPNPYGQTSIWTGLPVPTPENSKPLFTPLSATQKLKESQSKPPPSLRLNQSRYMTPPRRSGFGFSYSTYGTPNSAASTPGGSGLTNSMYGSRSFNGGSFGRSFGKSASASNLRSQFNGDGETVLSPSSFAASNSRWSGGNMRRLTIDRSIRNDLFSRPSLPALPTNALDKPVSNNNTEIAIVNGGEPLTEPVNKLKKRVSFDKDATRGQNGTLNGESGALVRLESDEAEADVGSRRGINGSASAEMESIRTTELPVVPEDRESDHVTSKKTPVLAKGDPQPGDYWMKPSRAELGKLPREKLQRFTGFEVGRKGCGKVVFNAPVDLAAVPLDDLYEKIVEVRLRSVTVYPDPSSKPPVGKGLNVPSTISIENSWPRSRGQPSSATSGPVFDKHINRLKKMGGTEFVNYEVSTGVWTFRVPHYTRYGLDYDDDELGQSQLSAPPDSISGSSTGGTSAMEVDSEGQDDFENDEEDTFAFKQKIIPGGFSRQSTIDYDADLPTAQNIEEGSGSEMVEESEDEDADNSVSMAGSYPPPGSGAAIDLLSPNKPILRAPHHGTPGKALITLDGDWAEQLQRTISPRKQNREALREVQSKILLDRAYEPIKPTTGTKNAFRTSIDIMNSLFSGHDERLEKGRKAHAEPDLEFPYAKRPKTYGEDSGMSENDRSWHASFKPHFTPTNQLIYKSNVTSESAGWVTDVLVEGGSKSVHLTSLRENQNNVMTDAKSLLVNTQVKLADKVPLIRHVAVPFSQAKNRIVQQGAGSEEIDIYELAHILFDEYDDEFTSDLSTQQKREYQSRIRKDRLSNFLAALVWRRHGEQIKAAEKVGAATAAVLYLTAKNIKAACDALAHEKDFHLMLLVAQAEQADDSFQNDIGDQMAAWRQQGIISEMTEEVRALYEILAGSTSICRGKQNVAVEDRATTFAISEKFGLDWIQAFSLCLWYGRQKNGDIHDVVRDFLEKLAANEESASPMGDKGAEDPLWILLKLFASKTKGKGVAVEAPIFPQALSSLSHSWDCQQTFRLFHTLAATVPNIKVDQDKADDLAMALAFEQSARGNLMGAVFALIHLESSTKRRSQLQDLLSKHAASLPSAADAEQTVSQTFQERLWSDLTISLKIPGSWIWRAKALYARSSNTPLAELNFLLLAKDFTAAHDCLLRRVAPRLVIDEDWATLRTVLAEFGENAAELIDVGAGNEWKSGGGVYTDFVALVGLLESGSARRSSNVEAGAQRQMLLQRLQTALTALNSQFTGTGKTAGEWSDKDKASLEERVALCEMGRAVAQAMELEEERTFAEKKPVLDLPLTADARLLHARALGVEYYRGVMAMAR